MMLPHLSQRMFQGLGDDRQAFKRPFARDTIRTVYFHLLKGIGQQDVARSMLS